MMKKTKKILLAASLALILVGGVGCAGLDVTGVKTPEPWRADMQTPEGRLPGAVREFYYLHGIVP